MDGADTLLPGWWVAQSNREVLFENRETFVCEPLRTPVGRFGGAYKDVDAPFLGAAVVSGLLERSGLPAEAVDDVLFAQSYASMEAPALGRVVALDAGLPITVGGLNWIVAVVPGCRR